MRIELTITFAERADQLVTDYEKWNIMQKKEISFFYWRLPLGLFGPA